MGFENKFARIMRNTGPARFFVPVGIILIIFGVLTMGFNTNDFVETVGKITAVEDVSTDSKTKEYDVSFTFSVDGTEHSATFNNLQGTYTVGSDIKVLYNPQDPDQVTNSRMSGIISPACIVLGVLAAAFGIFKTVKAFQQTRALDSTTPGKGVPAVDLEGFKFAEGVTELYCRHDGNSLKPGYIIEDADRNILFEAKMLKLNIAGPRLFEFTDHTTGLSQQHDVGHVTTQTYNNEFFSMKSWFKYDGKNIWDELHERGLRMSTNVFGNIPNLTYKIARNGKAFAWIETSSMYVHEEDEAQHKIAIPYGRYYYRIWTNSSDMETVFLTVFAISESEQTIVE